jgi:hypothetical protein
MCFVNEPYAVSKQTVAYIMPAVMASLWSDTIYEANNNVTPTNNNVTPKKILPVNVAGISTGIGPTFCRHI